MMQVGLVSPTLFWWDEGLGSGILLRNNNHMLNMQRPHEVPVVFLVDASCVLAW